MTDYNLQAANFLRKTKSTLKIEYLKTAPMPWDNGDQGRDIYKITLKRDSRTYSFEFGQSLVHSGKYHLFDKPERGLAQTVHGGKGTWSRDNEHIRHCGHNEWVKNSKFQAPSHYDILAALNPFMYAENVDDFALEYGYEKPSEALRVFNAVKNEADQLQKLFNDNECQKLSEIA